MRKYLLAGVASLAFLMGPPAKADLIIWANIGGTIFTCTDNQLACDANPAVGTLQLQNQTINGVAINTSIQTAQLGSPNILNTSSTSLINNNATPTAINFVVGATNFVGPNNQFNTSGSGVWQQAVGSDITLNFFNDPTNTQGGTGGATPGLLIDTFSDTATLLADSFSHSAFGPVDDPGLFSMTEQAIGTLTAGGQLLNRGQTEIKFEVPEPATMALFGAMLIGFGVLRRQAA